jgi:hypothetical protein
MLVYNTLYPLRIYKWELVGDIHPATNRIGVGFSTATIYHDGVIDCAAFYKKKLIAVKRKGNWVAALDTDKNFPRINSVEHYNE